MLVTGRGGLATLTPVAMKATFTWSAPTGGLCDRSTGQCKCFPGYTGEACRRTVCPNDCSGHGTCESVKELAVASGFTYGLWDAEKSMACSCDPGYGGIACSERVCPFGDDPLTKARTSPEKDQADEIQYIDLYSDVGPFSGKIFLKYTDYYGKQWHTDKIGVAVIPSGISNPDYSATDMQTATKAALENLPNNVIGNVDVSVGPCSSVLAGQCDTQGNDLQCDDGSGAATAFGATKVAFHCADDSSNYFIGDNSGDIFEYADKNTNDDFNVNTAATTCFAHRHLYCTRFTIKFTTQPGDLVDLSVDTSEVSILINTVAQTESQNPGNTGIGADVFDVLPIVDGTVTTLGAHGDNTDVKYYSTGNSLHFLSVPVLTLVSVSLLPTRSSLIKLPLNGCKRMVLRSEYFAVAKRLARTLSLEWTQVATISQ